MAFPTEYRKSGDVRQNVTATLERPDESGALNVSGASAITLFAEDPGGTLELSGATAAMVSDGTDGKVEYDVSSGEFESSGQYNIEWEVDWDGAGDTERLPKKNYQHVQVTSELA